MAHSDESQAANIALTGTPLARARVGVRAIRNLLRDPDDTRQVFTLGLVANYRAFPRFLARFAMSDEGAALLKEQPSIDSAHVDLDALRAMPEDTLGGAYVRYLDRNGLDPDLFQPPPGLPEIPRFVSQRMRQVHDVWHVLTGYAPDVAGEVALQAFTFANTGMPASAFIAFFGTLRFLPRAPELLRRSLDAYERGREAAFLATVRWEDHWHERVEDVRARYGIREARG